VGRGGLECGRGANSSSSSTLVRGRWQPKCRQAFRDASVLEEIPRCSAGVSTISRCHRKSCSPLQGPANMSEWELLESMFKLGCNGPSWLGRGAEKPWLPHTLVAQHPMGSTRPAIAVGRGSWTWQLAAAPLRQRSGGVDFVRRCSCRDDDLQQANLTFRRILLGILPSFHSSFTSRPEQTLSAAKVLSEQHTPYV